MYAQRVGVAAPFYLTKLLMPAFFEEAAVVNISSSRDRMSQAQTESCRFFMKNYIDTYIIIT